MTEQFETIASQHFNELGDNERMILAYILENRTLCTTLSIGELAANCNISRGTISRFAQKLGFEGYGELKTLLKWEMETDKNRPMEDPAEIFNVYQENLQYLKTLDFSKFCLAMDKANRIFVYATGDLQLSVANDLRRLLLATGKIVITLHGDSETDSVIYHTANKNDLFIFISLSGENENCIHYANLLRSKFIPTLSITRMAYNRLALLCDQNLYIFSKRLPFMGGQVFQVTNPYFILTEVLVAHYIAYQEQKTEM